jgi:methyltransferase (TIGR00027 family)
MDFQAAYFVVVCSAITAHKQDEINVPKEAAPHKTSASPGAGVAKLLAQGVTKEALQLSHGEVFFMNEREPSQTALLVAAYRARASRRSPAICNDPWAAALAGAEGEALAKQQDTIFPHLELWTAVRTAYLDQHVFYWTKERNFIQVVVLGAGLDTRAARLAHPGVCWFEVDHPASQAYKRRCISALPGYPTDAATYVACDFEVDNFVERLVLAGFRTDAPALILWEGVTPYLTASAVHETLSRITSGCHPGSVLLFDLINRAQPSEPLANDTRAFVAKLGEPVLFGSRDILPMLYEVGFRHARSVSFEEACLTLTGTYAREREFRFQRMVLCSRSPSVHPM